LPNAAAKGAPRVGVLSLQGDFACHRAALEALGAEPVRVTLPGDLARLDALILPGGESTTMLRLLETTGLRGPLESFVKIGPVLGTCAGVILLGSTSATLPRPPFSVLDLDVERNAYGRQIDSFSAEVETTMFDDPIHGVFIRAPRIRRVGPGVQVVARRAPAPGEAGPGEPVGVRAGHIVGLCFHPELTNDLRLHHWFLTEVAGLTLSGIPASLGAAHAHGHGRSS
jgi:5'-phosphate synthase pdxT subunit